MVRRARHALGLALALGLVSTTTRAQPAVQPFELAWEAPTSCPDANAVRGKIMESLGALFDLPRDVTVRAQARVDAHGSGYELVLRITRGSDTGERIFHGPSCEPLADAVAVVVAIAVDPNAEHNTSKTPHVPPLVPEPSILPSPPPSLSSPPPSPSSRTHISSVAPARSSSPNPARRSRPARSSRSTRRPFPPPRGTFRVGAGIGLGIMPTPSATTRLSIGLLFRRVRLDFAAGYWFPREIESAANANVSARFQLWSVGARACPLYPIRSLELSGCVGIEAGIMHGSGTTGLQQRERAFAPWAGASLAPGIAWRVHRSIAIWLELEALAGFTRPAFETVPSGVAHRAEIFGGRALAGLDIRWP